MSKSYLAYFGDIYLTNPKLLPDFDVVTMFHLCEFFFPNTASKAYGGMTDEKLLDLFTAKTKKGGHILFYTGSMAWNKALPLVQKWEKRAPVKRVGEFKTLLVFRKTKVSGARAHVHVERLGAGRLAGGVERDLLDPRLGLPQQLLAAALERLAALVDRDRLLERHLALFEPLDDRFKLLDRLLEGQGRDVAVGRVGHAVSG